ncbi:MAG: hypothetical protein H6835_06795 [Planctomycetes bacterium]|nr:hypothetical protein [Planctomycetota bacterium]
MTYDGARQRSVLFGGLDGNGAALDDTWLWDGATWAPGPSGAQIGARSSAALAYDERRGRAVLFGGLLGLSPVALDDTWEWDGATWTPCAPGVSPPARYGHAMAYDRRRGTVVLSGGATTSPVGVLDDLWQWDGASWTPIVTTASPPARADHQLGYDAARGRLVLCGGRDGLGTLLADTWEEVGGAWRRAAAIGGGRAASALAYDRLRHRFVLFGGDTAAGVAADTMTFHVADAADVRAFGSGCPGTLGEPVLRALGTPALGDTLWLELRGALPSTLAMVAVGTARQLQRLGACELYVPAAEVLLVAVADAGGIARLSTSLPANPSFAGLRLFAQGAGLDAGGAFAGLLSLSGGLELVLGR